MAVIHLATQFSPAGERLVAIKQIERREEAGRAAHARLVSEARLVFQLTHANICQVLDLGENEQGTFIVIEYVNGCDLGDLIATADPAGGMDLTLCLYVAREVARALDYAHRRTDASGRALGLVHGDVAPRNVLLSVEGEVKLADFGIARARGVLAPGSGLIGGTPGFIAPEVVSGTIDLRSDVYSLGMTMARALGGASDPDESPAARALARSDLGGVREIIVRSTAREPARRFSSAGEMERALALELSRRDPGFTPSILARAVSRRVAERESQGQPAGLVGSTDTDFDLETLLDQPALAAASAAAHAPTPPVFPPLPSAGVTASVAPARQRRAIRRRRRIIALGSAAVLAAVGASLTLALALRDPGGDEPARVQPVASESPGLDQPTARPGEPAPPPVEPAPPPVALATAVDAGAVVQPAPAAPEPRSGARSQSSHKAAVRPSSRESGFVSVSASPWGAVYIDGKKVAAETPLYRHPLPAGRHEVRVYFADQKKYSKRRVVDLRPGQHRSIGFEE